MPSSPPGPVPPASAASAAEPPWPPHDAPRDLAELRVELDRIDDTLHALLMERATVIEQVGRSGKRGAYCPGREASIIRRLLGRHTGSLPPQTVVRIWRELLAGTTAMQGPIAVAVAETDGGSTLTQTAREHFGALTPLHAFGTPQQAIAEVKSGAATVAVLPWPAERDTAGNAWWTALLRRDEPRIHVVARLPFWALRPVGAPETHALVIATTAPDASERDRSLLGLEVGLDVSRTLLSEVLAAAGLPPGMLILRHDQGAGVAHVLVEVDGFLSAEDPRLVRLDTPLRQPVVLGAYATPEPGR